MIDPVISLDGLGKRFGHTIAIESISMVIGEGEIFGFLGANGAGKTTTIRMLCGLTRPTRGYGTIHGLEIWQDRFRLRSQFGYVPQRFSLYADLTVLENMRFFGAAYRVPRNELAPRIEKLLSVMDLAAQRDAKAGTLSGGLKQLLSISCALLHEPSLLFLDEPTVGLDPVHRQYIWDLLYKLSQRGATIVVTFGLHLGGAAYGRCLYGLLARLPARQRLGNRKSTVEWRGIYLPSGIATIAYKEFSFL